MALPTFLIIGAQKSGTSWLANKLRQHPDVFIPRGEIHYFDKEFNLTKGIEWYREKFREAAGAIAVGDKTPDYLWTDGCGVEGYMPGAHQRLHRTIPQARLVILLRNPVERAISAVNHIIRTGRISPLHKIDDLLVGKKSHLVEGHGIIDKGRYHRQLQAYRECFASSQMLVLIFEEDVVANATGGLSKVCPFIGVDPSFEFVIDDRKINAFNRSQVGLTVEYYLPFLKRLSRRMERHLPARKAYPSESAVRKLYGIYEQDNEKLFEFLGRRVHAWELPSEGSGCTNHSG